ncbi:MAG: asparagine synthase-related protein [Desulfoprunum sp.]|nr:asparagine synthase-related protein [Desulfoprunum sp.]
MSGIAGVVRFDGKPISEERIESLRQSILHRGPDGTHVWRSGNVGFVNCLLQTTPESLNEQQPYQDPESKITITADARIDNREDLISSLGIAGYYPSGFPDSIVILEAYKKWGVVCPARLLGDFAFTIWDPQRQQLLCARDHVGARPFFYHISDAAFIFGSEIQAVLSFPEVARGINEERFADFLQLIGENPTSTFYTAVSRLAPSSILVVKDGKISIRKYWEFDLSVSIKRKNNREYAEEFREIFFEAVRCRMRSNTPVGCIFSGGLDSSSVACVAKEILDGRELLNLFSFNFPSLPSKEHKEIDEELYQQAVVETGGYSYHSIDGSHFAPFENLSQQLSLFGEPFFSPHLYLISKIWSLAQAKNIRVMLDGLDGDSVVSHGFERLQELGLQGRVFSLMREVSSVAARQGLSKRKLIYQYSVYPFFRSPFAYAYKILRHSIQPLRYMNSIINEDFAKNAGLAERIRPKMTTFNSAKGSHYNALMNPLITSALETMNIFSKQYRIENRSPFFDRRFMAFCLALPAQQKLQNGWSRFIVRQALKGVIPQIIGERTGKSVLTAGFLNNLLKFHKSDVDILLANLHPFLQEKIIIEKLKEQWRAFCLDYSAYGRVNSLNIYSVRVLDAWLKGIRFKYV